MTPEERLMKIENAIRDLTAVQAEHSLQIEKQNAGIRDLVSVSRILLDSTRNLRDSMIEGLERTGNDIDKLRAAIEAERAERQGAHKEIDDRLAVLLKIVDGMIRRNGNEGAE